MAAIKVLIAQRGDYKDTVSWLEEDEHPPSEEALRNWETASSLWPQRCLIDRPEPMEAFLCMSRKSSSEGYEEHFIRSVVQKIHTSMWGAKVYVVVDHDAENPVPRLLGRPGNSRFEAPRWFETVLAHGVSDILQWPVQNTASFGDAVERSEARMKKLITDVPNREWKCMIHTPPNLGPDQESFLAPYRVSSLNKLDSQNCLIVLQEKRENYMKFIRKVLGRRPGYRIIVGVIDQIDEEPPADLDEFCQNEGYDLVRFHGIVELYYFLRKLNTINKIEATPVPVNGTPVFKSHAPQLLITHSYTKRDKSGCLAAANDVWELTKDLRGIAKVKIYPAVKCVKLADILDELKEVLAWVHIGHGNDTQGLQQAEDELFKSAEDWLNSFAGYKSSLALAMFSSCRSAAVAKQFAESGAGVSIGFAQDVHKKSCVVLTKRVVKAALEFNGSRNAILEAFIEGRKVLDTDDPNALPVAFWASH
jgi:hypothetical protein